MIGKIKQIYSIINFYTLFVTGLSVLSTYLCVKYNWHADFPLTLVGTAVIFPIVFSIGGAYKRRENALAKYADLKAHGRAIYFASRDWIEDSDEELQDKARTLLLDFFASCRQLFSNPREEMEANENEVYRQFSRLSEFVKVDLRGRGLPSGEASRCNQFLSKMVISFESIKHIYQYRTPRTLKSFSDVFVVLVPIVYGPYFAHMATELKGELTYVMPVLLTLILVSLNNIQEHLEDPFDGVGHDDIMINAEKFAERLQLN